MDTLEERALRFGNIYHPCLNAGIVMTDDGATIHYSDTFLAKMGGQPTVCGEKGFEDTENIKSVTSR